MQRPHVVVPALDSFVLVQKFKYRPVYHWWSTLWSSRIAAC